jgi:osmotically inducible lipoprotein OsmB
MKYFRTFVTLLLLGGMLAGCAGMTDREKDTAIGAGIGAAVGYGVSGGSGLGTAAGAAAGGAAGHVWGDDVRERIGR